MPDDDDDREERLAKFAAARGVNDKIETLGAKLVKRGWSPEYVGATLLGAGADMLVRAGVDRKIVHDAIDKSFDELERQESRTAFPEILPSAS